MVTVAALAHHPAVPEEDIIWLYEFMNADGNPVPFERAIHIMKRRLFPAHYNPCLWDMKSKFSLTPNSDEHLISPYDITMQ